LLIIIIYCVVATVDL